MKHQVRIYQIEVKNGESRFMKFMRWDFIEKHGLAIRLPQYYKNVYEFEPDYPDGMSLIDILNDIYARFQGAKPEGYTGHSLSVSDLVSLDGGSYYVDSFGFVDITWDLKGKKVA